MGEKFSAPSIRIHIRFGFGCCRLTPCVGVPVLQHSTFESLEDPFWPLAQLCTTLLLSLNSKSATPKNFIFRKRMELQEQLLHPASAMAFHIYPVICRKTHVDTNYCRVQSSFYQLYVLSLCVCHLLAFLPVFFHKLYIRYFFSEIPPANYTVNFTTPFQTLSSIDTRPYHKAGK